MYDVAIIGAGPAGATLARLIGKSCRTLLLDRRRLTGAGASGAGKCCGGLLAPDAQKMLAAMGIALPASVLVDPQLFAVRCIDLDHGLQRHYQRHYMNVDRERFDTWLVSLVAPEVEIRDGCLFKAFEDSGGAFELTFTHNGRACTERATVLVGADGAKSLVRRRAAGLRPGRISPMPKTYVAIQEWFEAGDPQPWYSAVFDREVTDFYSWLIPKDGTLIVGSALPGGGTAPKRFELLKDKLRRFGIGLGRKIRRRTAFLHRPKSTRHISTGAGRVALVGEAAGLISPSSAEGISYAFRSAMILADLLQKGPAALDKRYRAAVKGLRLNIRLKNLKCHIMYDRLVRRVVLRSGVRSITIR
jgi:flavin-dependent dehydrogenase